jgi:hypothetical protein
MQFESVVQFIVMPDICSLTSCRTPSQFIVVQDVWQFIVMQDILQFNVMLDIFVSFLKE